jgi:hypothetical protein
MSHSTMRGGAARLRKSRSALTLAAVAAGAMLVGACGGGGDVAPSGATAYCDLVEVLESQDSRPSQEQLDQLVAVAPAEIRADVDLFGNAIAKDDMEAEGVGEAESRILAWEESNFD